MTQARYGDCRNICALCNGHTFVIHMDHERKWISNCWIRQQLDYKAYFSKICKKLDVFLHQNGVGHLLRYEGLLEQIWYTKTFHLYMLISPKW